jgi:acyl-CoA synthetase (AMP-forming)/AMP-acid ligase II
MMNTPMIALLRQAESYPQNTAFIFGDDVWTYERLVTQAQRLARGLIRFGLRKGDRVALHMNNRPEMLVAYYACFQLGLIAAPVRAAFTATEISSILERLQPALYLGEVALYNKIAAMDDAELSFETRFVVGGIVDDFRVENWEKLFDNDSQTRLSTAVDVNAAAVLINTSGTTGQSRFVTHTPSTLAATTDIIVRTWSYEADDVMIAQLPLGHSNGLISFLTYVRLGTPFVLLKSFEPDLVLDTIEQHRCTTMLAFPANFAALVERQAAQPRDLSSLRICLTVGDVCPVALQATARAVLGASLFNVWASTEVIGTLTYGLQPGAVSRIAAGAQIRLIDDIGADVRRGETGELWIRGPNVFAGYWNQPGATSEIMTDGWYRTGDLMRLGSGSEIWFVGRKKDIIIRGGTNISPADVENALLAAHPAVHEAAVVGVPDAVLGQRVIGFVKLARGTTEAVLGDILAAVADRLAPYKIPERLAVVDHLPRNGLSKVDRNALAKMAADSNVDPSGVVAAGQSARPSDRPRPKHPALA